MSKRIHIVLCLSFVFVATVLVANTALADAIAPGPAVAEVDVTDTLYRWFLANVLPILLTVLSVLLGYVATWFGLWLRGKARDSKLARVSLRVWTIAQAVVAHVDAELRPAIVKAASDGVITPEEGRELKLKAAALLRTAIGDVGMAEVRKELKLDSAGGLEIFLSGVLERALLEKKVKEAPLEVLPIAIKPPPMAGAAAPGF